MTWGGGGNWTNELRKSRRNQELSLGAQGILGGVSFVVSARRHKSRLYTVEGDQGPTNATDIAAVLYECVEDVVREDLDPIG
jgi:hypothetical protein